MCTILLKVAASQQQYIGVYDTSCVLGVIGIECVYIFVLDIHKLVVLIMKREIFVPSYFRLEMTKFHVKMAVLIMCLLLSCFSYAIKYKFMKICLSLDYFTTFY